MWPENWPVLVLFLRLGNQWRTGFNGRTGLDMNVAFLMLERMQRRGEIDDDEHDCMVDDLLTLESAALAAMHAGKT